MIDLHNHIIRYVVPVHPRTEPDPEIALRMARIAQKDGIKIICSTPHLRPEQLGEKIGDTVALMTEGVDSLNSLLEQEGIDVEVVGGAEIQLTEDLPELAAAGLLPTLGDGRHLLVELPISSYAAYAEQVLFKLQLQGFVPVIAHFERLATAPVNEIRPEELVQRGIKLQVNCESLRGKRGREVTRAAEKLLRKDLASGLGSDAHDPDDSPPILGRSRGAVDRLGGRGTFKRLTWERPLEIIGRA